MPPLLRGLEYGSCSGSPCSPTATRCRCASRCSCVLAFHHYDIVYRLRHQRRARRRRWVARRAAAGRGACSRPACSLLAGALPAGLLVAALALGALFVDGDRRRAGCASPRGAPAAYEDEEDDESSDRHGARRRPGTAPAPADRTTCRRRCSAWTATATILDLALANLRAAGIEEAVVVTGFAAERIEARAPELERRHGVRLELVLQPDRRGVEQRLLPLVRARGVRARACCSSTATRSIPRRRGAAAGRPRAPGSCSRWTTRRRSATRR